MMDALYISAIGLQAQKAQLDATANNLANLGTVAFKRQSVDFASILDRATPASGPSATNSDDARPNRVVRVDLAPGEIHLTGRPLDVAVIGAGFFEVQLAGGQTGYSRGGSLQIDPEGNLCLPGGQPLKADIRVPTGATALQILPDGSVSAVLPGESTPTVIGQLELATFSNPESLQYGGEGIFVAAEGMESTRTRPGEDGTQPLAVQSLEASNVSMTDEMVSLMLMQRVYELNSRVAQVADELMGMSNNLMRT